jgi:hypothetical protein
MNISETSVPGRWPRSWHKVCLTLQGATKEQQRGEVGRAWGRAVAQMPWESKYLQLRAAGLSGRGKVASTEVPARELAALAAPPCWPRQPLTSPRLCDSLDEAEGQEVNPRVAASEGKRITEAEGGRGGEDGPGGDCVFRGDLWKGRGTWTAGR